MLYPKIEDCMERAGNKYALAIMAAKRHKDLSAKMAGEFAGGTIKELSYALDEIANGKIAPFVSTY